MNPPQMTAEERRSRIVSGLASFTGPFNSKGKPKMRPLRAHLVANHGLGRRGPRHPSGAQRTVGAPGSFAGIDGLMNMTELKFTFTLDDNFEAEVMEILHSFLHSIPISLGVELKEEDSILSDAIEYTSTENEGEHSVTGHLNSEAYRTNLVALARRSGLGVDSWTPPW